jgi:hypothetical protein
VTDINHTHKYLTILTRVTPSCVIQREGQLSVLTERQHTKTVTRCAPALAYFASLTIYYNTTVQFLWGGREDNTISTETADYALPNEVLLFDSRQGHFFLLQIVQIYSKAFTSSYARGNVSIEAGA